MRNIHLVLVLVVLITIGSVLRMEGELKGQRTPSPDEILGFYETAAGYSLRGTISVAGRNGTSRLFSSFCGSVNSSSSSGFLLLESYGSGYESHQAFNWSGGYVTIRRFLRINGTVVENFTDRRPVKEFRFPDPLIPYLQMGFNGSKILHEECSQNLCTLSFEKSWRISSGKEEQMWSVTGRMIVNGRRPVEGQMRFVIRQGREWVEEKDVHFEIAYAPAGWSCLGLFTSLRAASDA